MGADWSGMDVSTQHRLAGCYRRGCLLRLFPEVKAVPCGDWGFVYPGLPGGSLASCRRKDTRRAADASHLGEGAVPLVLGEVPLEWGGSTGVAWVTWVWWRRARVQHAWSWGGRAVAWAILGSGLVGKGFLPFVGRHLLLGVRLVGSATLWSGYKVSFRRSVGAWAEAQSKPYFPLRTA